MASQFAASTAVLSCLLALATLASCNTEGKLHIYHIAGIVTEFSVFFFLKHSCLLWLLQGDILYKQRLAWKDPNNVLKSWDQTLANPCTWFHVTCNNNNSVVRVYGTLYSSSMIVLGSSIIIPICTFPEFRISETSSGRMQ